MSCLSDRHSKEDGEDVDGACVRGVDGCVGCVFGADASVMRFGETCGLPPQEECGSSDVVLDSDQFVCPVWQLQTVDYPFHYPAGSGGNEYHTTWHEPPQEVASSSADAVVHDVDSPVEQLVGTCDVGSGQSCSSSDECDDQVSTSDLCSWGEQYPDPDHVPDLALMVAGRRVQLRDVAQLPRNRSGWFYDPTWDRRPSSVRARPPSECGSLPSESASSSRGVDSLMKGDFGEEFVRWYHPHLREYGQPMPANAQMFDKWPG